MASLTKTAGIAILAHQAITHPATVNGSAQDISTKMVATIILFHASVEATANTNPGSFLIQVSGSASGDEDWATLQEVTAPATTSDTENMTATEPSTETVLAVASTTGFLASDLLYIQDTGTLADSEWNRCKRIVSNTSIDLIDGLTNQKDNADVIWNDALVAAFTYDVSAYTRIRVVFTHEGATGANCHVKALMVTADSIG